MKTSKNRITGDDNRKIVYQTGKTTTKAVS